MTDITDVPTTGLPAATGTLTLSRRVLLLGIALLLIAGGLAGYRIGTGRNAPPAPVVGRAQVESEVALVDVDGWYYAIPTAPGGVVWYDAHDTSYDNQTPPCLRHIGTYAWVRFGWVNAPGDEGDSRRVVTWVRCIAAP